MNKHKSSHSKGDDQSKARPRKKKNGALKKQHRFNQLKWRINQFDDEYFSEGFYSI